MQLTLQPKDPFDFSYHVGISFKESLKFCPVTQTSNHIFFNYHGIDSKDTRKKSDLNVTGKWNVLRAKYVHERQRSG